MTLQFEGVGFSSGTGAGGKIGTVVLVAMGSQPSTPYTVGSKWFYNGKIYTATTTTATDGGVTPSYDTAYLYNGTYYYWDGSALQGADESNLVHISGAETITGNKTFSGKADFQGETTVVTQATSDSSQKVATTQFVKDFAEDGEWQKPADWIDIRSGALHNSVYFLVAHSIPTGSEGAYSVATYPTLKILATISSSGTYDVFVDGIKIATTASGAATNIDWATLYNNGTLQGGFDVNYPSQTPSLTTHVVRITPSVSTNTITQMRIGDTSGSTTFGLLWAHFNISNPIQLGYIFGYEGRTKCPILEAVTALNDEINIITAIYAAFSFCTNLVAVPKIVFPETPTPMFLGYAFRNIKAKKIELKNMVSKESSSSVFASNTNLEEVKVENCEIRNQMEYWFNGNTKLKELPDFILKPTITTMNGYIHNTVSLKNTLFELSYLTALTKLGLNGDSTHFVSGVKGLVVSPEAPFDGAAPQINVSYTGMDRVALVRLFNSMPTVSDGQVINVTGATGANDLTADDLAIATGKGWSVTR